MYYMIDNYDSFVYNLAAYFEEAGQSILVRRADEVSLSELERLQPEGIILSPGPKTPKEAVESRQILFYYQNRVPILGVCLGHQVIGHEFGADVGKGDWPMHGKVTEITHNGSGVFRGLPKRYPVTRYHSLVVRRQGMPDDIQVDAWADDGVIMGISHKDMPIYGVQFHPEAVLTRYGHEVIRNFNQICKEWRCHRAV